jgi:hypothetical protein
MVGGRSKGEGGMREGEHTCTLEQFFEIHTASYKKLSRVSKKIKILTNN